MAAKKISELAQSLELVFVQEHLYLHALTHSSFANEQKTKPQHNERLELLGDAVLGLCITEYLYRQFPQRNEGQLSKLKSYIVSAESLAEAARTFNLGRFILLGKGEDMDGGQYKDSVLANVTEALLGACYLDLGLKEANSLILRLLQGQLERYQNQCYLPQNEKLRLQEYVQKYHKSLPHYRTTELFGTDDRKLHSCGFEAELYIAEKMVCRATGKSKKQAESHAAKLALELISENE